MLFEVVKGWDRDEVVMLSADKINDIPLDDVESMYYFGYRLRWNGESITAEQLKSKIRSIQRAKNLLDEEPKTVAECVPDENEGLSEEQLEIREKTLEEAEAYDRDLDDIWDMLEEKKAEEERDEDIDDEEEYTSSKDLNPNSEYIEIGKIAQEDFDKMMSMSNESWEDEKIRVTRPRSAKPLMIKETGQEFDSITEAAEMLNIPYYQVSEHLKSGVPLNGMTFVRID